MDFLAKAGVALVRKQELEMTARIATWAKKHSREQVDLVASMARRALTAIRLCQHARRKQQTLMLLSDVQLSDIGLARSQIHTKIHNGWFWE